MGQSASDVPTAKGDRTNTNRLRNKIFIAPLVLALSAWIIATVGSNSVKQCCRTFDNCVDSCICSNRFKEEYAIKDGTRLMDNIGSHRTLPGIGGTGALFTAAG